MSFGLSRGRTLDTSGIAVEASRITPIPDDVLNRPEGAYLPIAAWFAEPSRPLHIEIGSGKGTFLLGAARRQPGVNFLGIEYAGEFFAYAADRLRRAGVTNVRMLDVDAGEFVHWRVPSASVDVIHLYFADPWPKAKHHRRRMVSDRFLGDAARVLKPGGELRIVTDHADYWAWMEEHFARWTVVTDARGASAGAGAGPRPLRREPFVPDLPAREGDDAGEGDDELVGTNFERKYRLEGRTFHAAILRRV